ncbi:MaoC family dehydratase [Anaerobacillus sp. MEB173]|uniref:MaoC family dehydratase n=1 Tax=Anaerobacillus sp. MEB173 TaxID=3383345 RepID=UPI003F93264A
MFFGKKRRLGRKISDIKVGEKLEVTEKIEDKDLLLYLGLTNDPNPIFLQHDYASQTPYQKPIVPQIMITGIVFSAISRYLPGPGSTVRKQELSFLKPLYHYGTIKIQLETLAINDKTHTIEVSVVGWDEEEDVVLKGTVTVCPPFEPKPITYRSGTFENF